MYDVGCNIDHLTEVQRSIIPFVACGDLNDYDADRSYPLTVILN